MVIWYILSGVAGGILGGMGMGGGTLLIPLLTIFLQIGQKEAQAYNLISFLPMATVALIVHKKQNLLRLESVGYIVIPAVISAIFASFLALNIDSDFLKKGFGIFLILLGVLFFISNVKKKGKESKKVKNS